MSSSSSPFMTRQVESGREEANEARPLLSSSTEARDALNKPFASAPSHHRTRCSWPWVHVVALCIVIAVVSDIGEYLYSAPRLRLFESIICTRHYLQEDPSLVDRDGAVPEHLCKVNPVQDRVASILGWQAFFDSLPAILLPIPYGYLADKYGRKWILTLAMTGYTLSYMVTLFLVGVLHLPLQYVWLSSLCFLIGGGPTTGTTLLTTIVADVVPPELRSTVFFYRFCTDLIAELFVPPLTSVLMSRNMWIPLLGAPTFLGISTLMLLAVPETLPIAIPKKPSDVPDSPLMATSTSETQEAITLHKKWKIWTRQTRDSFDFVMRDVAVWALVLTFMISKVGRQSSNVLFQYVSKRYGWSISQAGLLLSVRAAVNIALFTAILPAIATFALSRFGAASRDLLLAKGSIIFMVLGALGLFFSATPAVMIMGLILFTLGTGFAPIVRSLVTSLVESHDASSTSDIGRLYALISVLEGIGSLVAAPGMAWAFRFGMSLGQEWLGLPFGFAAILFALVSIIVFSIKV
ncbi:major facilitator superfamily domain-containing protein [Xylariales sp. AK1849]|nr:major facilitator superfamily domain-containing protein [Xylariales sp. AK1849]